MSHTPEFVGEKIPMRPITRRDFVGKSAVAAGLLAVVGRLTAESARTDRIAAAIPVIPANPVVLPRKPRRLLIFDLNVGYGGHASIPTANTAFTLMGKRTGAFETVISRDPNVFERSSLSRFDAVFFNNTVGNLFTDETLRQNLIEFVYAGGGLMGVHGTTVAFTRWPGAHEDWPEFGLMLGARGANHRDSDEHVYIKLDDPGHPVNACFGSEGFGYRDEFFRYHEAYSRNRVRVLLSIDTKKTKFDGQPRGNCVRADDDYALAWVRRYGRGHVFHSTIAHNPYVFRDAKMLEFYLAAAQFVLGDLDAPTIPTALLTPAIRAQEQLGWRLGIEAYTFHRYTLFEAIDKTAQLGLPFMGGLSFQKVSADIDKNFEPGLTDDELKQIRLKLDSAGVRMLTYYFQEIPGDEAGCRRVFEFGRKIGIETFMSEPKPESLDMIEKFCQEYDINVAIHNHGPEQSPVYWRPEGVLKVCKGRSSHIGACGDVGYWMRAGIDPIEAVKKLGKRLITIQMHDLHAKDADSHDVPWGTGVGGTETLIAQIHRLGVRPTMFGLEYSYDWYDSVPEIAECIKFFNRVSMQTAKRGEV